MENNKISNLEEFSTLSTATILNKKYNLNAVYLSF